MCEWWGLDVEVDMPDAMAGLWCQVEVDLDLDSAVMMTTRVVWVDPQTPSSSSA